MPRPSSAPPQEWGRFDGIQCTEHLEEAAVGEDVALGQQAAERAQALARRVWARSQAGPAPRLERAAPDLPGAVGRCLGS